MMKIARIAYAFPDLLICCGCCFPFNVFGRRCQRLLKINSVDFSVSS
jgi:hypothetical protein